MVLTWISFGFCTAVFGYNLLWQISRLGLPRRVILDGIPIMEWATGLYCLAVGLLFFQSLSKSNFAADGYGILFIIGALASAYVIRVHLNAFEMEKKYPDNARGWRTYFGFSEFHNGNHPVPGINEWGWLGFFHFHSGYDARFRQSFFGHDRQRIRIYMIITARSCSTPSTYESARQQKLRAIDLTLDEVVNEDSATIVQRIRAHATIDECINTVVKEIKVITATGHDQVIYRAAKA